jgi:hypothetical protein
VLVATQAAMDGNDGGWAVIRGNGGLSSTQVRFSIDEDEIKDTERRHGSEQVAYLVTDQPVVVKLTPAP